MERRKETWLLLHDGYVFAKLPASRKTETNLFTNYSLQKRSTVRKYRATGLAGGTDAEWDVSYLPSGRSTRSSTSLSSNHVENHKTQPDSSSLPYWGWLSRKTIGLTNNW